MAGFHAAVNGADILLHTSDGLRQARRFKLLTDLTVEQQVLIQVVERGQVQLVRTAFILFRSHLAQIEIRKGHATTFFQRTDNQLAHCFFSCGAVFRRAVSRR
ncbi:hypothetical protein D3C84_694710 [compost metagenome]